MFRVVFYLYYMKVLTYCKQNVHRFKAEVKVMSLQRDNFGCSLTYTKNQIQFYEENFTSYN